jgi:hypothetical protein
MTLKLRVFVSTIFNMYSQGFFNPLNLPKAKFSFLKLLYKLYLVLGDIVFCYSSSRDYNVTYQTWIF